MSLENIYYIGQTVAVIAILVSLIFLAVQGRQTQKQIAQANVIAQAQLSKASTEWFTDLLASFKTTPEDRAFIDKAFHTMEPLNDHEQDLFVDRMGALTSAGLSSRELMLSGLMSKATYAKGKGYMQSIFAWPRPQKWWSVYRQIAGLDPDELEEFDRVAQEAKALPRIKPRELFNVNTPLPEDAPGVDDCKDEDEAKNGI